MGILGENTVKKEQTLNFRTQNSNELHLYQLLSIVLSHFITKFSFTF